MWLGCLFLEAGGHETSGTSCPGGAGKETSGSAGCGGGGAVSVGGDGDGGVGVDDGFGR